MYSPRVFRSPDTPDILFAPRLLLSCAPIGSSSIQPIMSAPLLSSCLDFLCKHLVRLHLFVFISNHFRYMNFVGDHSPRSPFDCTRCTRSSLYHPCVQSGNNFYLTLGTFPFLIGGGYRRIINTPFRPCKPEFHASFCPSRLDGNTWNHVSFTY